MLPNTNHSYSICNLKTVNIKLAMVPKNVGGYWMQKQIDD